MSRGNSHPCHDVWMVIKRVKLNVPLFINVEARIMPNVYAVVRQIVHI